MGIGKSCHWIVEPTNIDGGKAISNEYVLSFYERLSMVSEDCDRELILASLCSYRESMFAHVELSFRNKTLYGNRSSKVLEKLEKYSRLTKYVGCQVERVRYVTVANLNLI